MDGFDLGRAGWMRLPEIMGRVNGFWRGLGEKWPDVRPSADSSAVASHAKAEASAKVEFYRVECSRIGIEVGLRVLSNLDNNTGMSDGKCSPKRLFRLSVIPV